MKMKIKDKIEKTKSTICKLDISYLLFYIYISTILLVYFSFCATSSNWDIDTFSRYYYT